MSKPDAIRLRGVRQNNLKGWDLDLPLGKLIVVTGLSGAGKSSLVFETLHAEGQRRYVETFSPYVRQFMEMLERPKVDTIENIRPSIAIQQSNTVKTSRSTVGTMTELCDYMKVWFGHRAALFDPATGLQIDDDNPQTIWHKALASFSRKEVVTTFGVKKPENFGWDEILKNLIAQGFSRCFVDKSGTGSEGAIPAKALPLSQLETLDTKALETDSRLYIVQDRFKIVADLETRFLEAARSCLHFGQGAMDLFSPEGRHLGHYSQGLHSPVTGQRYRAATPALFSFNSPLGACPHCRGFGRIIEIDYRLVMPDHSLSIDEGLIKAFQGAIYSESQRDLVRACKKHKIPTNVPWREMKEAHKTFIIEGEPGYNEADKTWPSYWYGVKRFFGWLETNTYKMHVRVFLSRYRAYVSCPHCGGQRLQPEALNWKWRGYTLPQLYLQPISELLDAMREEQAVLNAKALTDDTEAQAQSRHQNPLYLSLEAIVTRLSYLDHVGLGYLNLDRSSRTLSGGETERVNLTACLGTALVDTLFVLDEPSIGLHARDIDRLIAILRRLTDNGNTVIVVEHDEAVMRAADYIIEIGPQPGAGGGQIVFAGTPDELFSTNPPALVKPRKGTKASKVVPFIPPVNHQPSLTAAYLSGAKSIPTPEQRRPVTDDKQTRWLRITGATKHNIKNLDVAIPLQRLVVLSGVSGAGKSTLMDSIIYQGLLSRSGKVVEDPADIVSMESDLGYSEIVLVDQSPVSRTPRSNAALYVEAWDPIRDLLASTEGAKSSGMTASSFSFNSGTGRCPACEGLGHDRIEMQFMADVYAPCPVCEGKRFRPEVLELTWNGLSVADILDLNVSAALEKFADEPKIRTRLEALSAVGLGYLPLGQPLNTLSGGESQRIKLVKYLARFGGAVNHALLLLDEPTTGLHRDDVGRLLELLQRLVDDGHSLIIIEHQSDVIKSADWILELGPEAGASGGKLVFAGTPEDLAKADTATSPFLKQALEGNTANWNEQSSAKLVAEDAASYKIADHSAPTLKIIGAREHNLKNVSLTIAHNQITVLTGVSGSGKSSLAFDIVFAEGQRRFMESMTAWARQYVEQLPRAEVDSLTGIPPTVAIEQRITAGTSKSTVATITEVAQYLRLAYARLGVQHSPVNGEPLVAQKPGALFARLREAVTAEKRGRFAAPLYLCSPLVRGRKGHHEPLAKWAAKQGYRLMRIDGRFVEVSAFKKLDRFKEHDIEVVAWELQAGNPPAHSEQSSLEAALKLGSGACLLARPNGEIISWYSTTRTDPTTGESYPELDPKHFSWNSAKGWCPVCHGYGHLFDWMKSDEHFSLGEVKFKDGQVCPDCLGQRLNRIARSVRLHLNDDRTLSLPQLLALSPAALIKALAALKLDVRGKAILKDVLPEIEERLRFMDQVGLNYLTLDRATATLSGGEAQRIRLAAQLGSNLSGVLYVLDEPSIGLHARDNARLIESLIALKAKGNTLLVVEHDDDTMRAADHIVDLGPGAGRHGGEIMAQGHWKTLMKNKNSITGRFLKHGIAHPLMGKYRALPPAPKAILKSAPEGWIVLEKAALRNLKSFTLQLPINKLCIVCGISGAGKSTLMRDLLTPAMNVAIEKRMDRLEWRDFAATGVLPMDPSAGPAFHRLWNGNAFKRVVEVDQSPIGKTPRSTPATYIGIFDLIRTYFATLPEAKIGGFNAGAFSFNTDGGRCAKCSGAGQIKLEMAFMPDTYVQCDECDGRRYSPALEEIRWKGKNISDVLAMSFEEAQGFFDFHSRLRDVIGLMVETGLGYLTLGQSSPTLSGGEAQRLKLVSELVSGLPTYKERTRGTPPTNLYLLEEPTIGLHLSDCEKLIRLLQRLVDQGHTVVVIEHNLDVIAEADYVVEIGPDGGERGGELLHQGTLARLLDVKGSPTAPFLKDRLK